MKSTIHLVIGTKKGEDNYWVIAAFNDENAAVEYKNSLSTNNSVELSVMPVPLMDCKPGW